MVSRFGRKRFGRKRFGRKKFYRRKRFGKGIRSTFRRNRFNVPSKTSMGVSFPDRIFVKLRYRTTHQNTTTAGAKYDYVFSGNNIFDPDTTGTGHQPLLFDTYASLYSNYVVHASKMKVTSNNLASTNEGASCAFIVTPSITSLASFSVDEISEQRYAVKKLTTLNPGKTIIKSYMSTAKIYGVPKYVVTADDKFSSAVSTGPTNNWRWTITQQNLGSNTVNQYYQVEMVFYVEFKNPISQFSS